MKEIWRECVSYPGLVVSNLGNVIRKGYIKGDGSYNPESLLTKHRHHSGYLYVVYRHKGKGKNINVHRLVAKTFLPNADHLDFVNHMDFNKDNNSVDNLEWCTPQQNSEHYHLFNKYNDGVTKFSVAEIDAYKAIMNKSKEKLSLAPPRKSEVFSKRERNELNSAFKAKPVIAQSVSNPSDLHKFDTVNQCADFIGSASTNVSACAKRNEGLDIPTYKTKGYYVFYA